MEAFFKEISGRLETESIGLGRHIEPQHKKLLGNSYECMSKCYRNSDPIEKSAECAERCNQPVQNSQNEIQQVVENIQTFFQNCMQSCKLTHGKNEDQLKPCISTCTDNTIGKFVLAKSTSLEIIRRYS